MSRNWADTAYAGWGPALASFVDLRDDSDVLKTSVINLVMTRRGERVMRCDFGSEILGQLHEPNDEIAAVVATESVRSALESDDRIQMVKVAVERQGVKKSLKVIFRDRADPMGGLQEVLVEMSALGAV